jgi:ribosome assembly protein 1
MAPPKTKGAARGTIHGSLLDGLVTFTIRATPIPPKIIEYLLANTHTIARMVAHRQDDTEEEIREEREAGEAQATRSKTPEQFWSELEGLCARAGGEWVGAAERIWCFGPKRVGANLLLDPVGKSAVR